MQTVKTAAVVAILLGVMYGVYTMLNTPEQQPAELEWPTASTAQPPTIDLGTAPGGEPTFPPFASSTGSSPAPTADRDSMTYGGSPVAASLSPPTSASDFPSGSRISPIDDIRNAAHSDHTGYADPAGPMEHADHGAAPAGLVSTDGSTESGDAECCSDEEAAAGQLAAPSLGGVPRHAPPVNVSELPADAEPLTSGSVYANAPRDASVLAASSSSPGPSAAPVNGTADSSSYASSEVPANAATANPAAVAASSENVSSAGASSVSPASLGAKAYVNARRSAQQYIEEENYREALFTLSIFYNSNDLTAEEQQELRDILDPLAGRVIYSQEHLITAAHKVGRDEDLFQIADQYGVPWQLLANINGIDDPEILVPGSELKVVPGPFRADVDLQRGELTLFANRLYAGRFPISVGADPSPKAGVYEVREKQRDRTYYAADGRTFPPGDPRNPYGNVWVNLGGDVAIHGSPSTTTNDQDARLGCISLSPRDARDVYGILSIGSRVVVR